LANRATPSKRLPENSKNLPEKEYELANKSQKIKGEGKIRKGTNETKQMEAKDILARQAWYRNSVHY